MHNNLTMQWAILNDPINGPRLAASWVTDKPRSEKHPGTERAPIILIARDESGNHASPAPIAFGTYAFPAADEQVAS